YEIRSDQYRNNQQADTVELQKPVQGFMKLADFSGVAGIKQTFDAENAVKKAEGNIFGRVLRNKKFRQVGRHACRAAGIGGVDHKDRQHNEELDEQDDNSGQDGGEKNDLIGVFPIE